MAIAELDEHLDFVPLFPEQDEPTIRARWVQWANEGITEESAPDEWVDTREGGFWHFATIGGVRESARIYDRMGTEVVMAGHPLWAWDTYLDDHAEVADLERLAATYATGEVTFSSAEGGEDIAAGTNVGVEPPEPNAEVPEYETTAGGTIPEVAPFELTLPVRATLAGAQGNVGPLAVSAMLSNVPGVAVANAESIRGGEDPETDERLRKRLLDAYRSGGGGWNQDGYRLWAMTYAEVGRVTVVPVWNGPGTVRVIVSTADGDPVSDPTIEQMQADIDPVAAAGAGAADIGHTVTVDTAETLATDVAATIEFEQGFSLDGDGGTIALRATIRLMIESYLESVEPGGEVVKAKLLGRIVSIDGVHDVNVTAPAANVPVGDDPPQVPVLDDLDLTAGAVP